MKNLFTERKGLLPTENFFYLQKISFTNRKFLLPKENYFQFYLDLLKRKILQSKKFTEIKLFLSLQLESFTEEKFLFK